MYGQWSMVIGQRSWSVKSKTTCSIGISLAREKTSAKSHTILHYVGSRHVTSHEMPSYNVKRNDSLLYLRKNSFRSAIDCMSHFHANRTTNLGFSCPSLASSDCHYILLLGFSFLADIVLINIATHHLR